MSSLKTLRTKETYRNKVSSKKASTIKGIFTSIANFENYCMERHGKANMIPEMKEAEFEELYDMLQDWINWNNDKAASTIRIHFSNVKKFLHYMGIKLHKEDIDNEMEFPSLVSEDLYGISLSDLQKIFNVLSYKNRTLFTCQLSGLHRIGEMVQLKKKHLILDNDNIIVKIPAYMAKFNKGRTTFWSKEASKLVRPMLKKLDDDELIFTNNPKPHMAEMGVGQALRRAIVKVGLDMRYESTGRFMINTHGFRAYGITKLSRHDPNFAKKIAGQKGYLLQYDRIDDEEKLETYQKYESDLLIDKDEINKSEINTLREENCDLRKMTAEQQRKAVLDIVKNLPKEEILKLTRNL
ncbi:MAG: tyrosine-type recombinase/integrase [Candidatus Nitrosopumilus sp. bin_7KS]